MIKKLVLIIVFGFLTVFSSPSIAYTVEISGPRVKIHNNDIIVNTGLSDLGEIETTVKTGIEKEIIFTVELFRAWDFWPDEFVVSKKIKKIIKYDNLRGQFFISSFDGTSRIEKKFKDFKIMKIWAFMVDGIKLVNIRELEPGNYYLRVVVESKSRNIPPVIGILMLFIPEVEMSLAKESETFNIGAGR